MRPRVEWFWRDVAAVAALALVAEYGNMLLMRRLSARVDFMHPAGLHELAEAVRWA